MFKEFKEFVVIMSEVVPVINFCVLLLDEKYQWYY